MKGNAIRWILAVLALCMLAFFVSSPALAAVAPLGMDQKIPGNPPLEEGWVTIPAKTALQDERVLENGTALPYVLKYYSKQRRWEAVTDTKAVVSDFDWKMYEDESISIRTEFMTVKPAYKSVSVPGAITYIKIADPSQLRTAMSFDDYNKKSYVWAEDMAKHVNAIVAINGDFFKYHYNVGYVVRQGEFYRDMLNGKRDVLLIDDRGDFHAVRAATSETMKEYLASLPEELTIVNTFTLGPVLVENGQITEIKDASVAKYDEFQWAYPQQRIALLQLGELEYAAIETYGKTNGSAGLNLQEFADLIQFLFPDCQMAYNLDGGGSTNMVVNGRRVHTTPGHREISDIIYFASAYVEGE